MSGILLFGVALLMLGISQPGKPGEIGVSDLLADLDRYDGQRVVLVGTMLNLKSRRSRKGFTSHMFNLSDGRRTILVLVVERPPCQIGTTVVAEGRVGVPRHASHAFAVLEAERVRCR